MVGLRQRPGVRRAIAVAIITAVRGLPVAEERKAAEGGALPILGSRSGTSHSRASRLPGERAEAPEDQLAARLEPRTPRPGRDGAAARRYLEQTPSAWAEFARRSAELATRLRSPRAELAARLRP